MNWTKHKNFYIILMGMSGGLILVVFAIINKTVHQYPMEADAFLFPFIYGFASWSIIGIVLFRWFDTRMKLTRAETMAITDPLTGTHNRRFFDEVLKKLCERSIRYNAPISLAMMDIDHFKMINDKFGHQCGDYVLKQLTRILEQNNRACDYICRYGGEEFTILLPDTKLDEAVKFAERNRVKIQEEEFVWENNKFNITASFGVCQSRTNNSCEKIISSLIESVDRALYNSKTQGRNRVSIFKKRKC